jgi:hypothetical protein
MLSSAPAPASAGLGRRALKGRRISKYSPKTIVTYLWQNQIKKAKIDKIDWNRLKTF